MVPEFVMVWLVPNTSIPTPPCAVEFMAPALMALPLLPRMSMAAAVTPIVMVPLLVKVLLSPPCMPTLSLPTVMAPLLITLLLVPRLMATGLAPTVIAPSCCTVTARLFSTPVPKPVALAPLQVTVLPACTQAADAGSDGAMANNARDDEASAKLRRTLDGAAIRVHRRRAINLFHQRFRVLARLETERPRPCETDLEPQNCLGPAGTWNRPIRHAQRFP